MLWQQIDEDLDKSERIMCEGCGHWHRYDFCPRCGQCSPYFKPDAVNQRERECRATDTGKPPR